MRHTSNFGMPYKQTSTNTKYVKAQKKYKCDNEQKVSGITCNVCDSLCISETIDQATRSKKAVLNDPKPF